MEKDFIKMSDYTRKTHKNSLPTDLMTLNELEAKYGLKYDYLYKLTKRTKQISYFCLNTIKVSEATFLVWFNSKFCEGGEA